MAADNKDPWSRSVLTPSPSLASSCSDNGIHDTCTTSPALVSVGRDHDLVAQLDLNRRDDRAQVKKNPFTLAKMNATRQKTNVGVPKNRDTSKMGSSIVTAEDARKQEAGKPKSPRPRSKAPQASNGWTNARGDSLPSSAPSKLSDQAPNSRSTSMKGGTLKTGKTKTKPTAKPKSKSSNTPDKITFHRLPSKLSASKDFPIVLGLEKQKTLPTKANAAASKLSPTLLDALVTGRVKGPTAKKPKVGPKLIPPRTRKIGQPKQSRATRGSPSPPTASISTTPSQPSIVYCSQETQTDTSSIHLHGSGVELSKGTGLKRKSPTSQHHSHAESSSQLKLTHPSPVRPTVVSKLEALAASPSALKPYVPTHFQSDGLVHGSQRQSNPSILYQHEPTQDTRRDLVPEYQHEEETYITILPYLHEGNVNGDQTANSRGYQEEREGRCPTLNGSYGQPYLHRTGPPSPCSSLAPFYEDESRHLRSDYQDQLSAHTYARQSALPAHAIMQDSEWSTLRKRPRLTIAPGRLADPKSSGPFRLPIKHVSTSSTRLPSHPVLTTPTVQVSVWSPTRPLSLSSTQPASPRHQYVSPHMRVLQHAGAGPNSSLNHSTPSRTQGRHHPYPTPATTARGYPRMGYDASSPERVSSATKSSESEDWAAAWALPAAR